MDKFRIDQQYDIGQRRQDLQSASDGMGMLDGGYSPTGSFSTFGSDRTSMTFRGQHLALLMRMLMPQVDDGTSNTATNTNKIIKIPVRGKAGQASLFKEIETSEGTQKVYKNARYRMMASKNPANLETFLSKKGINTQTSSVTTPAPASTQQANTGA